MTIHFAVGEDGDLSEGATGQLVWDDQLHNVSVIFQVSAMQILCKDCEIAFYDELLDGTWSYDRKNLVFHIMEDYIFDGQYSELVFVPIETE